MIVLVHGGGFWRGCRVVLSPEAYQFKQAGFVVLLIDYRLACEPTDHVLIGMGSTILQRCGWYYRTSDSATGFGTSQPGAAFHDVLDAIKYGRQHINSHCGFTCWDGTVFVGGGSGGGTQALMAGVKGFDDGREAYQVDGAFGWSATLEMGTPTCDAEYSKESLTCWVQENHYVCQDVLFPVLHAVLEEEDPNWTSDSTWYQDDYLAAVPYTAYTTPGNELLPPIFFANGGFCFPPGSCNENIGYEGSVDLAQNSVASTDQCRVDQPLHGTQYLSDYECLDDPGQSVFATNVAWLVGLS
jgi:acetyl esterase/lipase